MLVGQLLDEVDEVIRIPASQIEPNPTGVGESAPYVKGIAKMQDSLVVIIDLKLLLEEQPAQ
jgi:purine-binding chemotaxis protein CheW